MTCLNSLSPTQLVRFCNLPPSEVQSSNLHTFRVQCYDCVGVFDRPDGY